MSLQSFMSLMSLLLVPLSLDEDDKPTRYNKVIRRLIESLEMVGEIR
jgi:hypothetical protein